MIFLILFSIFCALASSSQASFSSPVTLSDYSHKKLQEEIDAHLTTCVKQGTLSNEAVQKISPEDMHILRNKLAKHYLDSLFSEGGLKDKRPLFKAEMQKLVVELMCGTDSNALDRVKNNQTTSATQMETMSSAKKPLSLDKSYLSLISVAALGGLILIALACFKMLKLKKVAKNSSSSEDLVSSQKKGDHDARQCKLQQDKNVA